MARREQVIQAQPNRPRAVPAYADDGRRVIANALDFASIGEAFLEWFNQKHSCALRYRRGTYSNYRKGFFPREPDVLGDEYSEAALEVAIFDFLRGCVSWVNSQPRPFTVHKGAVTGVLYAVKMLLECAEEERNPRRRINLAYVAPGLTPDAPKV